MALVRFFAPVETWLTDKKKKDTWKVKIYPRRWFNPKYKTISCLFGQDLWVAYFFFYLLTLCRFYPQYCPIPVISYPQLENELFCNIFYLRHLCDTEKFPDWPIREPVRYCTFQTNFELALLCNWFKSACATVKANETCRRNRLSRGRILFPRFAAGHACLPRVVITHTIAQFLYHFLFYSLWI